MKKYSENNITIINDNFENHLDIVNSGLVVTDPPYNVGYHYNEYSDNMSEDEYYKMLVRACGNKSVVIHYMENIFKLSYEMGVFPEKLVAWVYPSNTPRQWRGISWFNHKPDFKLCGQPYKNPTDKRIAKKIEEGKEARLYDWWEINQVKNVSKEKTEHPCQIPLEVMIRILKISNVKKVIDPFLGSGTTLQAAKILGIEAVGFEIDEKYFDISKKRIFND